MNTYLEESGYILDALTNVWSRPGYAGIAYSDGDEVEQRIASIVSAASDLDVLSTELRRHCTDWPSLYHLSGTRANILRPFESDLRGDILEIGAGCGAITRYLGECGGNVLALEGSPRRAAIARSRTRDLPNVTVLSEAFDLYAGGLKFDAITLIGVFEYANLFMLGENPPLRMLDRIRALLKPGGRLFIAIENQLGLKYFAGAPEDHLGQPMYGIEGRYRKDQVQTYGRAFLARMLEQAGFLSCVFLAPFPDYKLPVSIITEAGVDTEDFDASAFAWQSVHRDPQLPRNTGFSLELTWPIVFQNKLAIDLANSLLVVASPVNQALHARGVLAYHYSTERAPEFCKETVFRLDSEEQKIVVDYNRIGGSGASRNDQAPVIKFVCPKSDDYRTGRSFAYEFIQLVAKDGWEVSDVARFLKEYLAVLERAAREQGVSIDLGSPFSLVPGNFFDVTANNLILHQDGCVSLIDREWELTSPMELGHLLFRTLLQLIGAVSHFGRASVVGMTHGQFVDRVFDSLQLRLRSTDFDRYLTIEEQITEHVTGRPSKEATTWWRDHPLRSLRPHEIAAEYDGQTSSLKPAIEERKTELIAVLPSDEASTFLPEQPLCLPRLHEIAAEYDGEITSLRNTLAERDSQIANLSLQLREILSSKSWRLTKPLRHFRRVLTGQSTVSFRCQVSTVTRSAWYRLPISVLGKQRLKSAIFSVAPFLFSHTGVYRNWRSFRHVHGLNKQVNDQVTDQPVPRLEASPLKEKPVELICFYLPQFHSIPENDAWWGEGFTEWTNVRPAQPQFLGHYQPHVPADLGYYNLLDPSVQSRQVELAKLYGIGGFCFYFYWFGGKRLLESPTESYLNDSSLDLPFCLCWANENWSRRWDGLDSEILIAQKHSPEDDIAFIEHVARYMRDNRYIRISGKPLLLVYRPSLLPSAKETAKRWRDWCRSNGIGEVYLAYTQSFETVDPSNYGFDAAVEFPPNNSNPPNITENCEFLVNDFKGSVHDWSVFIDRSKAYQDPGYKLFRGVNPSWDNTARRKNKGSIFAHSSPFGYQEWLLNAIVDTNARVGVKDERMVFVNAWNEWAEGAHLEPDVRYGYAYLEATRLAQVRSNIISGNFEVGRKAGRLAIIVHAFYMDVFEQLLAALPTMLRSQATLLVSAPDAHVDAVRAIAAEFMMPCEVFAVENRGRDVLPFLKVARTAEERGFSYFLKLHTKKSLHREDGDRWRDDIYKKLLDDKFANMALPYLASNPDVGLIAPEGYVAPLSYYWGANKEKVEAFGRRLGLDHVNVEETKFVAGTMFYGRISALQPLLSLAISDEHFEPEQGQVDGTTAHAIERAIGLSAVSVGMRIVSTNSLLTESPNAMEKNLGITHFYKPSSTRH